MHCTRCNHPVPEDQHTCGCLMAYGAEGDDSRDVDPAPATPLEEEPAEVKPTAASASEILKLAWTERQDARKRKLVARAQGWLKDEIYYRGQIAALDALLERIPESLKRRNRRLFREKTTTQTA